MAHWPSGLEETMLGVDVVCLLKSVRHERWLAGGGGLEEAALGIDAESLRKERRLAGGGLEEAALVLRR